MPGGDGARRRRLWHRHGDPRGRAPGLPGVELLSATQLAITPSGGSLDITVYTANMYIL